jgi:hypothetical protein
MEDNKAVNMEGCQQCAFFVWRHKPNKLIFFIVWIILKQLAWQIPISRFLNCFLIASLRIDEWWISLLQGFIAPMLSKATKVVVINRFFNIVSSAQVKNIKESLHQMWTRIKHPKTLSTENMSSDTPLT